MLRLLVLCLGCRKCPEQAAVQNQGAVADEGCQGHTCKHFPGFGAEPLQKERSIQKASGMRLVPQSRNGNQNYYGLLTHLHTVPALPQDLSYAGRALQAQCSFD
jgi:hypothetical protein